MRGAGKELSQDPMKNLMTEGQFQIKYEVGNQIQKYKCIKRISC